MKTNVHVYLSTQYFGGIIGVVITQKTVYNLDIDIRLYTNSSSITKEV